MSPENIPEDFTQWRSPTTEQMAVLYVTGKLFQSIDALLRDNVPSPIIQIQLRLQARSLQSMIEWAIKLNKESNRD